MCLALRKDCAGGAITHIKGQAPLGKQPNLSSVVPALTAATDSRSALTNGPLMSKQSHLRIARCRLCLAPCRSCNGCVLIVPSVVGGFLFAPACPLQLSLTELLLSLLVLILILLKQDMSSVKALCRKLLNTATSL